MSPTLRDYQREAVGAALEAWESIDAPALLLATGLGKTVIFSEIARIEHRLGRRTCVLVHRDELVRQTVTKLRQADPSIRVGVVQGQSMGVFADVVVASVQTLIRRLHRVRPDHFQRIIVDECHHAAADSYMAILAHFQCKRLGVTATMARSDRKGLGAVWDKVVFERGIPWGVEHGFLCPAEVRTIAVDGLDTDKIKKSAGDLAAGDLGKAMSSVHAGRRIAEAYATFGQDAQGRLRRAISFAPTIDIAEAWAADYERAGARCAVITGSTSVDDRQAAYRDVAAGRKDVLSSVMVLTEGFDLPAVEVAIIGRPTKSMPLLTQMVGRVLRPSPGTGKTAALLLDVVGALGGGLARSYDLSIPQPAAPVAPGDEREAALRREAITVMPPERVDWVVRDLLTGAPIRSRGARKGHTAPEWLRTAGGVPFLPATMDYPWRIFCWAEGPHATPWWRKQRDQEPEPLSVPEGFDPRDLHPGLPDEWREQPATDAQAAVLSRRGGIDWGHTKLEASLAIETLYAGRELDPIVRPRMAVTPPPGCE